MTFKKILESFDKQLANAIEKKYKSGRLEQKTLTKIDRLRKQILKCADSLPDEPAPLPGPVKAKKT